MTADIMVSLSVTTSDPAMTTRAVEVLSRALAGLALEGISGASLNAFPMTEDES